MTEAEWMACTDPQKMLEFLQRKKGPRKKRLFACACCRLIWDDVPPAWQRAVEISEKYADEAATKDALIDAFQAAADEAGFPHGAQSAAWACDTRRSAQQMAFGAAYKAASLMGLGTYSLRPNRVFLQAQAQVLRDIFQPFRRTVLDKLWLRSPVPQLAESIYTDRAFDRMPILGDALEDAGCTNADILNHCRQPGEHVRGCWLVDLLLDKK